MNSLILKMIAGGLILALIFFFIGFKISGCSKETNGIDNVKEAIGYDNANILKIAKNLPVGTSVEISLEEGQTPEEEYRESPSMEVGTEKVMHRFLSWFGLGATEAAVKDQGFVLEGEELTMAGQSKGYGFLEQLWSRIKSLFWVMSFGTIALVIMLFIPATAPIVGMIFRGIAAIIPGVGSVTERLVAGVKYKKPLVQSISGGQTFKTAIRADTDLSDKNKEKVIHIFNDSMMKKQDADSQKRVKSIKVENGFS